MGLDICRTKRFMYNILKDKIPGMKGCIAITGARKAGKTTLLLQLHETFKNESIYYNLSDGKKGEYRIDSIYEAAYKAGKKYVFLDEVCKLDYYDTGDFLHDTQKYADVFAIIMTGNVSSLVEKLSDDLNIEGGCGYYELPPIMYAERLCWDNGIEEVSLSDIKRLTSSDKYADYLRNENSDKEYVKIRYLKKIILDAVKTQESMDLANPEKLINTKGLIKILLKYVSLAQHIYKKEDGSYDYSHSLGSDAGNLLYKEYERQKEKWHIINQDIECLITILYSCHLVRERSESYLNGLISVESKELADRIIDRAPMIFEFPWMACFYLSGSIKDNSALADMWVKYSLLLKCNYIYHFCDNDILEGIDIIYKAGDDVYGLEVKNRPYSDNSTEYIQKIENITKSIGLKDYFVTSTDRFETRVDIIALSLELEYMETMSMEILRNDFTHYFCTLPIPELVNKHFC